MNNKTISRVYDYNDTHGVLLFQVIRFEPKGFSQRRPFQEGFAWGLTEGWYQKDNVSNDYYRTTAPKADKNTPPHPKAVWLEAIEPVLYRLPELQQGIITDETIFICEGEKDADNLAALGFTTTTCPMGAGKWQDAYTETLRQCRNIVIVADKDEPGLKHAQEIAEKLYEIDVKIRIIEPPDLTNTSTKDISDWIMSGGTKESFLKLVEECSYWMPTQQPSNIYNTASQPSIGSEYQELVKLYGEPYYLFKNSVIGINQSFWAGLHQAEHIQLYEPDEREFYRYNPQNGLYSIISVDIIKQEIAARILEVSRQQNLPSLERKRTNTELNNIVAQLKGISEKKNAFARDKKIVHLANGVIIFKDDGKADFCPFAPTFYSRNQCPIPFDPSATCNRFLNELLYPAVSPDDAILLQKIAGLCLLGDNLIQRFLILEGEPGRGKSTLALIIQRLVGQSNVTELRTKHLNERFEIFRYLKKNLLVGVDVPGKFLSEKGAHVIKRLVGGDWLDAEQKGGTGSFPIQGNFCVLITANTRLHVRLDGDIGAWRRRLLIIKFAGPAPLIKVPHFDKLLIDEEGSGMLNWALEGLGQLFTDIRTSGDIQLTEPQKGIINKLLEESDSVRNFLQDNIMQDATSDLSTEEIVEAYAEYCPLMGWTPKPITIVHLELESLMLELFRTSKSNSISRNGKNVRGFRRVSLKFKDEE